MSWYIDAIDARGGVSVASERPSHLDTIDMSEEYPVAYISGPLFAPEFIASRAIGLAIARQGYAQPGLYIAEGELEFESAEAVAEFTRRAYVGGTSGDGEDQGGTPLPPVPEGGGPREDGPIGLEMLDLHEGFDRELDPVLILYANARHAYAVSEKLDIGQSAEIHFEFTSPTAGPQAADARVERLVRGAVRLLHEMERRNPAADPGGELLWLDAFDGLVDFMTMTNMVPRYWFPTVPNAFGYSQTLADFLTGYTHALETLWYRHRPHTSNDPVRDLARLPVPPDCAVPLGASQSLLQLLSAVAAKPQELLSYSGHIQQGRAELVLLAAAWLNLGADTPSAHWREPASKAYLVRLCSRAEQWLAANFPRLMFAPGVEKLFADSARLPV